MVPVLEMRNLWVETVPERGPPVPIVHGINLHVERGEVLALIGESGSGKTTIALAALAYTRPGLVISGGEVLLGGRDVLTMTRNDQREMRGRRVAYLAQSAAAGFNPAIRIGEQVIESALLHGDMTRAEAEGRAQDLYRALELPDPDRIARRYPHQVSGGQLQRLMAAMALCGRPDLLVLDEPTTALDVVTQIEVLKAFKTVIRDEGTAAIYVTHDLPVVAQIADRILVLRDGRMMEEGPTWQITGSPGNAYTRRLIGAVRSTLTAPRDVDPDAANAAPAVVLQSISARYGSVRGGQPASFVLQDIDLTVGDGRIVGIIGESGSGKSTLARVIAGLLPAAEGQLQLCGAPLASDLRRRSREELRHIQIVFQMADTALNPRQQVAEIIGRPLSFYHGLRGTQRRERIADLLEMVELPRNFADRFPAELSGGQKQRVNLARALAADPKVLLCDEVTSALDTLVGANIIALLRRLRAETGTAMVFISHDLSTVASFADEIVVLYAGRVVEHGPVGRVLSPPWHPYTRLLIASVPDLRVGWLEETTVGQARQAETPQSGPVAQGCPFVDRCPLALDTICASVPPPLRKVSDNHLIACHLDLGVPSSDDPERPLTPSLQQQRST